MDVLDRFFNSVQPYNPDYVVRLTSDCPLIDANLIDNFIKIYKRKKSSYLSNTYHLIDNKFVKNEKSYYPDGLDIEVFYYDPYLSQKFSAKKVEKKLIDIPPKRIVLKTIPMLKS